MTVYKNPGLCDLFSALSISHALGNDLHTQPTALSLRFLCVHCLRALREMHFSTLSSPYTPGIYPALWPARPCHFIPPVDTSTGTPWLNLLNSLSQQSLK